MGDETTGLTDGAYRPPHACAMRGQVELVLRWVHNPALVPDEPVVDVEPEVISYT